MTQGYGGGGRGFLPTLVGGGVAALTGNPVLGSAAAAATPLIADRVSSLFASGNAPTYNTNQVDEAARGNINSASNLSAQQREMEAAEYNQRAGNDLARQIGYDTVTAQRANAAANANTARNMAAALQGTLNQQYVDAGARVNQAAANTQQALNNSAQIVASMFR